MVYSNLTGEEENQNYSAFVYRGHILSDTDIDDLRSGFYCMINDELTNGAPVWYPKNISPNDTDYNSNVRVFRRNRWFTIIVDSLCGPSYLFTSSLDADYLEYAKYQWKKIGQGYTWYKPNAHNALVNATLTNVLVKFPSSEVSDMYNCGIHDFEVNSSLNGIIIKAQGVYELMFNFEIAVQSTNSYCRVEVDAGRSSYINGSSDQIGWFAGATAGIPEGASLGFSVSKTCFQNFLENEEIKFYTYSTTPIKIISMWIQMRRF